MRVDKRAERRHPFGTARIAALALRRTRVELASWQGGRWTCPQPELAQPAALLYPGPGATLLTRAAAPEHRLATLVVVDGTWSTAAKLIRDNGSQASRPAAGSGFWKLGVGHLLFECSSTSHDKRS